MITCPQILYSCPSSTWSEWALMWNISPRSLSMETGVKQSAEEPACVKSCLIWRSEVAKDSSKSITKHSLAVFYGHSRKDLFALSGIFHGFQTEYVPSNLIPKSPWKFVSEVEYHEKIFFPMQEPAVLEVSLWCPRLPVCCMSPWYVHEAVASQFLTGSHQLFS